MKILVTLLVLFSSFVSLADDISDFEIEGMSLGESLLDYMSEEKILNNQTNYFQHLDSTFSMSAFKNLFNSNLYNWIQVGYLTNDKKYKIHIIDGVIDYRNNIEDCYDNIKKIKQEISSDLDLNLMDWYFTENHNEQGYNVWDRIILKSGIEISLSCQDFNKKGGKQYFDHLKINIATKEFNDWVHQK